MSKSPVAEHLSERLDAVLPAIYAAFGTGWEDAEDADPRRAGLAEESIFLGRVIIALLATAPSVGADIGRVAALSRARRDSEALVALDALTGDPYAMYQPYWATRAHVLAQLGRADEARAASRETPPPPAPAKRRSWRRDS